MKRFIFVEVLLEWRFMFVELLLECFICSYCIAEYTKRVHRV